MKNKGFTLVELLAVIAILAVLVIIALPNVMGMFKTAKKNSFTTEAKNIAKATEETWISHSMFNTSEEIFSRCQEGCSNPLDLSGRDNLDYYVKVDKSGNIVEFYVTDGTYQYSYEGTGLTLEDINGVDEVSSLNDNQILTINRGLPSNKRPPECTLQISGNTITLNHNSASEFGLIKNNTNETYNSVDSLTISGVGTYYGYTRSNNKTSTCNAVISASTRKCTYSSGFVDHYINFNFDSSINKCKATITKKHVVTHYNCVTNQYGYKESRYAGTSVLTSCPADAGGSCANGANSYSTCRDKDFLCPGNNYVVSQTNPESATCYIDPTYTCSSGELTDNNTYCYILNNY